jgi:hypothetical protein
MGAASLLGNTIPRFPATHHMHAFTNASTSPRAPAVARAHAHARTHMHACAPPSLSLPVSRKQLRQRLLRVAQQRCGAYELLSKRVPGGRVHSAAQVVGELKGVFDADLWRWCVAWGGVGRGGEAGGGRPTSLLGGPGWCRKQPTAAITVIRTPPLPNTHADPRPHPHAHTLTRCLSRPTLRVQSLLSLLTMPPVRTLTTLPA